MGDISEEWEIEEEDSQCSEESKSPAMWILDKGLNIGKKIAITGVVISSAPFVLPPIMVISAIVFAFSIPSGILLTSYVCTEKLMSKLFPVTGPDHHSFMLEQKDKELEAGYLEDGEELADEYQGKAIENENCSLGEDKGKERYGYEEEPLTKEVNIGQSYDDVSATKEDVDTKHIGSEEKDTGEKNPTVETTKTSIQQSENKKKVDADVEGDTVAGKSDEKDGVTVVAEKMGVDGNETSKKSTRKKKGNKKQNAGAEPEELQEKKEEEKVNLPTKIGAREIPIETREGKQDRNKEEKVDQPTKVGAREIPIETREGKQDRNKEEKVDQPTKVGAREIPIETREGGEDQKKEEEVNQPTKVGAREIPIETREDRAEIHSSAKVPESKQAAATSTGKEVGVSEESIQERLDALRAIVGYKASPHGTYIAELRALYMFTGVEPPVSMKESSDLVEIYDKLGLLMSIVGVK